MSVVGSDGDCNVFDYFSSAYFHSLMLTFDISVFTDPTICIKKT